MIFVGLLIFNFCFTYLHLLARISYKNAFSYYHFYLLFYR
jgi:hypothetical protein